MPQPRNAQSPAENKADAPDDQAQEPKTVTERAAESSGEQQRKASASAAKSQERADEQPGTDGYTEPVPRPKYLEREEDLGPTDPLKGARAGTLAGGPESPHAAVVRKFGTHGDVVRDDSDA